MPASSTPHFKKINKAPSVRVLGVCRDYVRDSNKGVVSASTMDEPILHMKLLFFYRGDKDSQNKCKEEQTSEDSRK